MAPSLNSVKIKEWLPVAILGLGYAGINSLEVIIQWLKNPNGALFVGITHYYADFFLYAAQMRQGAAGSLWYVHRFTDEPLPATWIYWFNNLIGFIGHLVGLSPFASYNLALFFLVFTLALFIYYLFKLIYPSRHLLRWSGFLLFLFASPFIDIPALVKTGEVKLPDYLWFSPMPALNRAGGVPHQVWQTILLILVTLFFTKILNWFSKKVAGSQQNFDWLHFASEKTKINTTNDYSRGKPETSNNFRWRPQQLFIIGGLVGLTLLAATANPITMFIFVMAAGILTFGQAVQGKSLRPLSPFIVVALVSLPAAIATNREFDTSAIFTAAKIWELGQYVDTDIMHFLLSLGALSLFIPFGLIFSKRLSALSVLLVWYSLIATALFFSPIPRLLGTTPIRYLSPFGFIGFIILAVEGISAGNYSRNRRSFDSGNNRVIPVSQKVTTVLLISLILALSLPGFVTQIINRLTPEKNPYFLLDTLYNHVPPEIVKGLLWLGSQPDNPARPVVLVDSNYRIEVLVPALANKTVFSGHPLHTLSNQQKEALAGNFFNSRLSPDEVKLFLNNHRIGLIIAKNGGTTETYLDSFSFNKKIYNSLGVIIYKIGLP